MSLDNSKSAPRADAEDFGFEYDRTEARFKFPKKPKEDRVPLCYAEWTWTPINQRYEYYYVTENLRTKRVLLWARSDDGEGGYVWLPYCSSRMRPGENIIEAGFRTLAHAWYREATGESQLDRPHQYGDHDDETNHLGEIIELVWGDTEGAH